MSQDQAFDTRAPFPSRFKSRRCRPSRSGQDRSCPSPRLDPRDAGQKVAGGASPQDQRPYLLSCQASGIIAVIHLLEYLINNLPRDSVRVLLVEDNDFDAELVAHELATAGSGFHVTRVATLANATECLAAGTIDIVLLDLGLPDGGSPTETVRTVIGAAGGAPIVILSGNEDPATIRRAISLGAHDYLIKGMGLTAAQLLHALNVAQHRSNREAASLAELGAFADTVAHDIRMPLTVVSGTLSTLAEHGDVMDAELRETLLARAQSAADKLQEHVSGLLAYAMAEDRHQLQEVALGGVVTWVKGLVWDRLEAASGSLVVSDLPTVLGDEAALRAVLLNLISNSIAYREPGRALRIEISSEIRPDGSVLLQVADNGQGIPEESRQDVFGRGVRLQADAVGLGIGLATVQRLVRAMTGDIWVGDGLDGHGSSMQVSLMHSPSLVGSEPG